MKLAPSALAFLLTCALAARADESIAPGHSAGGEAFNEGPRQAAVLMGGTGDVHFTVTTKSPDAQQFFDQGVGQLHGFWYFEAERSFRQVAALDPACAMAYWGMAMSNTNNAKRAGEFIKKADSLKANVTRREQLWIGSLSDFYGKKEGDDKARRRAFVRALERLSADFPDDLECKAFMVEWIWDNAEHGLPLTSYQAVDALAREILAANPHHPAHHYRIHLWNGEDDRRALDSAAQCGQAAPAIAHMWHMPGHTYTKLHRYADAAWAQEASARVDHAYMAAARIMPEQIHNYAHNNDWLVEDLEYIGRAHDAMDLGRNMIELPRLAPKASQVGKRSEGAPRAGFSMGRNRLLETALRFELWPELTGLEGTMYLAPADDLPGEMRRLCALGVAHYQQGRIEQGDEKFYALQGKAEPLLKEKKDEKEKPAEKGKRPEDQGETARALIAELSAYRALAHGQLDDAREQLPLAKNIPLERLARLRLQLGDLAPAEKGAREAVDHRTGEITPLATLATIQWQLGHKPDALETFRKLRPLSAQADLDTPVFAALAPIALELHLPADWRPKLEWNRDTGHRPALASLGPFRWQPYAVPAWTLTTETGERKSLADYHSQPVLVVFYLGSGCGRCLEQLNLFSPMAAQYAGAGISIVAVSTEAPDALHKTVEQAEGGHGFAFPILADPTLAAFKAYRAYDDFEKTPLHGVFLIDAHGQVRWQDISFEAFRDPKWLLDESRRLLALPGGTASPESLTAAADH
jgi:peroxiredoxin